MNSLQRCFSTLGCPDLTLAEAVSLAARHAVSAIELRAISGSTDIPSQLAEEFGTPAVLSAWLADQSVRVVALGTSVRLFGDVFDLAELAAFAPWAESAGAPYLRVFDGGTPIGNNDMALARARIGQWAELRAERGWTVDLMIETHNALVAPGQLARFVDAVPDARLLWDAHHTWAKGGTDPVETWRRIAGRVVHMHVKDSLPDGASRRYVLPGQGDFPVDPLLAAISADHAAFPVSLEWERLWHPHLEPLDQALSAAADGWW